MGWKAELVSVTKERGNVAASVTFTNGEESITEILRADDLTTERLAAWAGMKVASLEKRDASIGALRLGPITLPRDA